MGGSAGFHRFVRSRRNRNARCRIIRRHDFNSGSLHADSSLFDTTSPIRSRVPLGSITVQDTPADKTLTTAAPASAPTGHATNNRSGTRRILAKAVARTNG